VAMVVLIFIHSNSLRVGVKSKFLLSNLFFPAKKALDERWEVVNVERKEHTTSAPQRTRTKK
jgi:hypothetical protein